MSRLLASLLVAAALSATTAPALHAREPAKSSPVARKALLPIDVHRSPTCGCCMKWVEHLRDAGFQVRVHEHDDMQPIKLRLGVPDSARSCHTAKVGDYFVEGHVPAADIKRLLADKPAARGIAVPGMPLGSPGMEVPDGTVQPYEVQLVGHNGASQVYSRHGR
jgi:hypothetical protein